MKMFIGGPGRLLRRSWKVLSGLIGLVLIMIWSSGMLRTKRAPGVIDVPPGAPLPAGAEVVEAVLQAVPSRVALGGTVRSERKIQLSARLSAYVEDVRVTAGSIVRRDDLLVALDQREILEELSAAEAQLAQAETAYQRAKRLLETHAIPMQAYEAAESVYKSASANVERIKVMVSYTRITSPMDGVVADRYVETGDLAGPGQVLLTVYDPARMRLEVPVPARLIAHFEKGTEVRVLLDQRAEPVIGTVTEVVSEFDTTTRTRRVKLRLEGVDADILPGTYGQVVMNVDPFDAILLPEECIIRIGQLELVQEVRDGWTMRRLVRTGPKHEGLVEILSGLAPGASVLRHPLNP